MFGYFGLDALKCTIQITSYFRPPMLNCGFCVYSRSNLSNCCVWHPTPQCSGSITNFVLHKSKPRFLSLICPALPPYLFPFGGTQATSGFQMVPAGSWPANSTSQSMVSPEVPSKVLEKRGQCVCILMNKRVRSHECDIYWEPVFSSMMKFSMFPEPHAETRPFTLEFH